MVSFAGDLVDILICATIVGVPQLTLGKEHHEDC